LYGMGSLGLRAPSTELWHLIDRGWAPSLWRLEAVSGRLKSSKWAPRLSA
jgi:hypothetical protein